MAIASVLILQLPVFAQYENDIFTGPVQAFGGYETQGVACGDYNADGYVDLYLSNGRIRVPWEGLLYKNNGDGTFDSVATAGVIVTETYISGGCSWGDYDNDGDLDLYVANAINGFSTPPNSLYLNNNDGTFSNAAAGDIVAPDKSYSATVGWVDFDEDGWLDGFSSDLNQFSKPTNHSLYRNDKDGSFVKVENQLTTGISGLGGFSWIDFDMDGDMDVVTVSGGIGASNVLWVNNGNDFTPEILLEDMESQGASWGDYDNDGDFDLFITNFSNETGAERNILLRNDGAEAHVPLFHQVSEGDVVADSDFSHSSSFADFNNDGFLDLIVANDGGYKEGYRSRLYTNNGEGELIRFDETVFSDSATFCRSVACADIENDGDMDVIVGRDGKNRLFINKGNDNNYVQFSLRGNPEIGINASAIGTILKLKANGFWQLRDLSSQTGRGAQNSPVVHFGLGNATIVDSLVILWPNAANTRSVYTGLAVNTIHRFDATKIKPSDTRVLNNFQLYQNYPNPFNPVTTIRYSISPPVETPYRASQRVELTIHNILGEKIAKLVDGVQNAGYHTLQWNAGQLPAGVYYYSLRTDLGTITRKMVYIK